MPIFNSLAAGGQYALGAARRRRDALEVNGNPFPGSEKTRRTKRVPLNISSRCFRDLIDNVVKSLEIRIEF